VCLAEREKFSYDLQAIIELFKAEQEQTNGYSLDSINEQQISNRRLQWQNYFSVSLLIDVARGHMIYDHAFPNKKILCYRIHHVHAVQVNSNNSPSFLIFIFNIDR